MLRGDFSSIQEASGAIHELADHPNAKPIIDHRLLHELHIEVGSALAVAKSLSSSKREGKKMTRRVRDGLLLFVFLVLFVCCWLLGGG